MITKVKIIPILIYFLIFLQSILFPLEKTIILGMEDGWEDIIILDKILKEEGKWGYKDLLLEDAQLKTTNDTDLLIHFNENNFKDVTGNYRLQAENMKISHQYSAFGGASGYFRSGDNIVNIIPEPDCLFYKDTWWSDFTLEFWLYPVVLSNNEIVIIWDSFRLYKEKMIFQSFICSLEDRKLFWKFKNFFVPFSGEEIYIELKGLSRLLPRVWHHHMIRYKSSTGILEYLLDGVPEAITYTVKDMSDGSSVCLPYIGKVLPGSLCLGKNYTGLIDELRLSRHFEEEPALRKYHGIVGIGRSKVIDLKYTGSRIKSIDSVYNKPSETEIYYFYRISDELLTTESLEGPWIKFAPGKLPDKEILGRYIQIQFEMHPDGLYKKSPVLSNISVTYEPDIAPPPPPDLYAIPGNEKVNLHWIRVHHSDVKGYKIYYGDAPGYYFGKGSNLGDSPIDVGNVNQVELKNLKNGKLYFFAIVTYDYSTVPHLSSFSKEVSIRPSSLLE